MKIKSLIVSVLSLAILALSGCSKSSDSTPAPVSQPTSTTAIAGVASKGPIAGAVVQVFAIRSNVTDTVPFGTGRTDARGNYAVQTFGYKGPVVVEVTQGAYNDEISGTQVTMKTPLRAMFSSVGTGTTSIAVTPLTELAAKNAEGRPTLSTDAIDAANNYIGVNFGVPGIVTTLPIANSGDANQTNYVNQLKVFQQLVYNSMQPGELAAGQVKG